MTQYSSFQSNAGSKTSRISIDHSLHIILVILISSSMNYAKIVDSVLYPVCDQTYPLYNIANKLFYIIITTEKFNLTHQF